MSEKDNGRCPDRLCRMDWTDGEFDAMCSTCSTELDRLHGEEIWLEVFAEIRSRAEVNGMDPLEAGRSVSMLFDAMDATKPSGPITVVLQVPNWIRINGELLVKTLRLVVDKFDPEERFMVLPINGQYPEYILEQLNRALTESLDEFEERTDLEKWDQVDKGDMGSTLEDDDDEL